jgi:hypothetical protein
MASKNRAQTASVKPTSAEQPLAIIFAHWGIGGDAYKDVTNVVRDHAKPDSIPPRFNWLFGDPYKGIFSRWTPRPA